MNPKPVRVLVVDDSDTARLAMSGLLREEGLEIVGEARGGDEAVKMAARLHPDVITMDVMMPDLDGLEATRRILEKARTRIVVVSALGQIDQVELSFRALAAGALEAMPKPYGDSPAAIREAGQEVRSGFPSSWRHGPGRGKS